MGKKRFAKTISKTVSLVLVAALCCSTLGIEDFLASETSTEDGTESSSTYTYLLR